MENKDKDIKYMNLSIDAVKTITDILSSLSIHAGQEATQNDMNLQELKGHIIKDWPSHRNDVRQDIRPYWTFRDIEI